MLIVLPSVHGPSVHFSERSGAVRRRGWRLARPPETTQITRRSRSYLGAEQRGLRSPAILNEVGTLVKEARTSGNEVNGLLVPNPASLHSLPRILGRIQAKLNNLDAVLGRFSANGPKWPARVLWLKEEPNVVRIRNELGALKQDLTTALGLSSSSTALQVQVELQDLRLATDKGQISVSQTIVGRHSSLGSSVVKSQHHNERGFDRLEQQLLALTEQIQQQHATSASRQGDVPWLSAHKER